MAETYYELFVQDLVPKKASFKKLTGYRTKDYLRRKQKIIKKT